MRKNLCHASIGLFVSALLVLGFLGCGGNSGIVSFLSLSKSSSKSFDIEKSKTAQTYVLIPFSADSYDEGVDPDGSTTFGINFSVSGTSSKLFGGSPLAATAMNSRMKYSSEWLDMKRRTVAFEDQRFAETQVLLKKIETSLAGEPRGYLKTFYKKSAALTAKRSPSFALDLPATLTVEYDQGKNLTGKLRGQGTSSAIYVDEDYDSQVSDSTVQDLLNMFDTVTQKRDRTFWGNETDINGDGAVIMMLTDGSYGAHVGKLDSGIIGFFRPIDLLPQAYLDAHGYSDYNSNEMEIIFSVFPAGPFYKELIDATLAHEFFHLINMGIKTVGPLNETGILTQESLFLNEGMAHLSEDITGNGFDAFATAGYFLDSFHLASMAGSVDPSLYIGFGDDCLERRGATMLFLRYLFEQKGGGKYSTSNAGSVTGKGVDFLKALNSSAYTGIHNIEKTYGDSLEDLFKAWVAALFLDGTGITDDSRYNYDAEENDNFTDQKRGFNLRGSRVLPDDEVIQLNGPVIYSTQSSSSGLHDVSSSVFATGGKIYSIEIEAGKSVSIDFTGSAGLGLGMTVIKVE